MCCGNDNRPPRVQAPIPQTNANTRTIPPAVNQVLVNQQRAAQARQVAKPSPQRPTQQDLQGKPRPIKQHFYMGSR